MNTWPSGSGPDTNRRRSQRVILSVPITVSGESANSSFDEDTQTLVVNAHGALIALGTKISNGQPLQVHNRLHPEKQACRVTYVGPTVEGKTQVGVEFTQPAPHFWHITFPPEDWSLGFLDEAPRPEKKSKP